MMLYPNISRNAKNINALEYTEQVEYISYGDKLLVDTDCHYFLIVQLCLCIDCHMLGGC